MAGTMASMMGYDKTATALKTMGSVAGTGASVVDTVSGAMDSFMPLLSMFP